MHSWNSAVPAFYQHPKFRGISILVELLLLGTSVVLDLSLAGTCTTWGRKLSGNFSFRNSAAKSLRINDRQQTCVNVDQHIYRYRISDTATKWRLDREVMESCRDQAVISLLFTCSIQFEPLLRLPPSRALNATYDVSDYVPSGHVYVRNGCPIYQNFGTRT